MQGGVRQKQIIAVNYCLNTGGDYRSTPCPCWHEKELVDIGDILKEQERKEAELCPRICDGYEERNEAGEWVVVKKPEAFTAYAREYVFSGVIGAISSSAVKVLNILASLVGRRRFTKVGNKRIAYYSGLSDDKVKRALRELKYYNIIVINYIPGGSRTKKLRRITIHRWDVALPLLIKENKVVMKDNKVTFIGPYPYKRKGVKSTLISVGCFLI